MVLWLAIKLAEMPEWRNWHTRATQNRVSSRTCGFNSHLGHQNGNFEFKIALDLTRRQYENGSGKT